MRDDVTIGSHYVVQLDCVIVGNAIFVPLLCKDALKKINRGEDLSLPFRAPEQYSPTATQRARELVNDCKSVSKWACPGGGWVGMEDIIKYATWAKQKIHRQFVPFSYKLFEE